MSIIMFFIIVLGRIHVVDVATCAEVDCLVEAGSVRRIDVAQDEENRVLASQVVQTRIDDSTVHKVTVFSQADGSWDRLLLARETRPVSTQLILFSTHAVLCSRLFSDGPHFVFCMYVQH